MHIALTNALLATTTEEGGFDPAGSAGRIRLALLAFIAVGLAVASLWGLFLYGGKGHMSKALKMVGTCIICLIPVAIAAPIAFGKDIFGWLF